MQLLDMRTTNAKGLLLSASFLSAILTVGLQLPESVAQDHAAARVQRRHQAAVIRISPPPTRTQALFRSPEEKRFLPVVDEQA